MCSSDLELVPVLARERRLENAIQSLRGSYDWIFVDCPPSLGLLSLNAMAAVDEVLLPLQPHFLALHGLSKLLETMELVADRVNPRLRLLGVVLCMYESATRLSAEVTRDVAEFFAATGAKHPVWTNARLFHTRVRRNIRLAEAPSFGRPALYHDKDSRGALAYLALAGEMLRRDEEPSGVESDAEGVDL